MCKHYIKLLGFMVFPLFLGIAQVSRPVWGSRWSKTGDIGFSKGIDGALLTDGRLLMIEAPFGSSTGCKIFDPATGIWDEISHPGGSYYHAMAMLLYNGKVLYVPLGGGTIKLYDSHNNSWNNSRATIPGWGSRRLATLLKNGKVLLMYEGEKCVLYDHAGDTLILTGDVYVGHYHAVEVMLPSGKVLASGKFGSSDDVCELYDPETGTWELTDSLNIGRSSHVGVLLPPPWSKVLVAGGSGANEKCELYDPLAKTWAYTGDLNDTPRQVETMALLPSGKVLIAGGGFSGGSCELYDPDAKTWSRTDSLEEGRSHFSLAILQTGKELAVAGQGTFGRCEIYDPSEGAWTGKPNLNVGRAAHTTTLLPIIPTSNCSTNVFIVGGENSSGPLASCELYNYSLDNVTLTDELTEARSHHTAVLLVSGQVLVAGGKGLGGNAISSSEIYTAGKPGNWTPVGAMTNARFDHTATLLKNGDILATGGEDAGTYLSSCELYNGSWTPTANPMATPRARHTAIILLNGNILVIGGQTTGGATATCELWNGTTWTNKTPMNTARYWHTATLLQSGKVLVAGGTSDGSSGLSSCEIFDPDSNKWFPEGNLNQARYQHNTTLLYSGLVLVTGGNGGVNSCETYDPATHKWTTDYTGTLITGRSYHSSVLVPDTMPFILAIGGKDGGGGYLNSIEEYDVGLGYRKIWQSTITSHPAVTTITSGMNIRGTLFRGVSEADGGNHCHIVSNDHPIISLVRVGGGNWQGNGGGEIMYMPLSSKWDTAHTKVHLPANAPAGYYRLWSIVNGIPCKWYEECPAGIEESPQSTVHSPQLRVYPNPATTKSEIRFQVSGIKLSSHQAIRLSIYDLSGRLVRSFTIHDSRLTTHKVTWDRRNNEGKKVKSGIYFYRLNCKDFEIKGKFVILK